LRSTHGARDRETSEQRLRADPDSPAIQQPLVLRSELLQSGVFPQDIDTRIEEVRSDEEDDVGARLCALAFLIGKLPREEGADTGLRATPETFADLLVKDLKEGSGTLRT
jgi:hypothetical protein